MSYEITQIYSKLLILVVSFFKIILRPVIGTMLTSVETELEINALYMPHKFALKTFHWMLWLFFLHLMRCWLWVNLNLQYYCSLLPSSHLHKKKKNFGTYTRHSTSQPFKKLVLMIRDLFTKHFCYTGLKNCLPLLVVLGGNVRQQLCRFLADTIQVWNGLFCSSVSSPPLVQAPLVSKVVVETGKHLNTPLHLN